MATRFCWFEHQSVDPTKAQRFYGETFGWKVESFPMGGAEAYAMIKAGDVGVGGYGKAEKAGWVSYLLVQNVDESIAAVVKAGGKKLADPFDIPTVGRMGLVADPQGAPFWVMAGEGEQKEPPPAPGTFAWNEHWSADGAAAVGFYEKAFGFTHDDMNMGPAGTYHILKDGDVSRAGLMTAPGAPTGWLPYVNVDDCDAAVTRAKRGGATVEAPPTDIPNVGRFAILVDPQGARIGVLKSAR